MTAADVRALLLRALRLDLVGPEPDEPQAGEVLSSAGPAGGGARPCLGGNGIQMK